MYEKPALICEEFVPNEYVAACYDYTAQFYCDYGSNGSKDPQTGNLHGSPCAITKVDIQGQKATGTETGAKEGNPIFDINLFNFDLSTAHVNDMIGNVEWWSRDPNGTGNYYHKGSGKITSEVLQDPTRPNHS